MSEVKRFKACPFLAAFMAEGVDCVLASDYDKQAQEIERLSSMVSKGLDNAYQQRQEIERLTAELERVNKAQGEAEIPTCWVALRIEYELGYPEDVAFGPKVMMDRLKKWLDRYFEMRTALPPIPATQVLVERELLERVERYFSGFVSDEPPAFALGSNGLATIRAILSSKGDV
ncbi:MAG: hypothetical protein CMK71_02785 [Pseudomonadaceae bacterium]|nr:hypothetical protein [Pseudomonadaceae bacterium]